MFFLVNWNGIRQWILLNLMDTTTTYFSQNQITIQRLYNTNWLVAHTQKQLGTFFDPYVFVLSGVEKYLVRHQGYASYALVLRLGSHQTTKKLYALNSYDVGNCSVMVVSLNMTRMRLFAVNSRNTPWKVISFMTYMSTFWFSSFHTYGSNTMLPRKRNSMLENIGIILLVTRHDVSQPRQLT